MIPFGMAIFQVGMAAIPPGKMARRAGKMIFPVGTPALSSGNIPAPAGTETAPVETDKIHLGHKTIHVEIRNGKGGKRQIKILHAEIEKAETSNQKLKFEKQKAEKNSILKFPFPDFHFPRSVIWPLFFCLPLFGVLLFAVRAELQGKRLGLLQPFELFAEGGLQAEKQGMQFSAFKSAPLPAGMRVEFFFCHGFDFFRCGSSLRNLSMSTRSCPRPADCFNCNNVS
jgi:hypothetical protein